MSDPIIDRDIGLENLQDPKLYSKFLGIFRESELQEFVVRISLIQKSKNWKDLRATAHSLKGCSGYIGAVKCQKLAGALQVACERIPEDELEITGLVSELLEHASELKDYISRILTKHCLEVNEFNLTSELEDSIEGRTPLSSIGSQDKVILPEPYSPTLEVQSPDNPNSLVKRIIPPLMAEYDDPFEGDLRHEEWDAFAEITKHWKCLVL